MATEARAHSHLYFLLFFFLGGRAYPPVFFGNTPVDSPKVNTPAYEVYRIGDVSQMSNIEANIFQQLVSRYAADCGWQV